MYSKVIEKFVIKINWIYSAISLNIRIVSTFRVEETFLSRKWDEYSSPKDTETTSSEKGLSLLFS